jgi:hypothetical protein
MKLEDGSVLENIAFEDIQVTNASLAEGHGHPMKRDDDKKPDADGDGIPDYAEDEEVEELDEKRRIRTGGEDRARGDVPADRIREGEESDEDVVEEVEEIEAGAEINESNDQWYQRNLFENLTKKWAK